ncbi:MAG: YeaH/YhbH family protein [Alphaproteobacteria bacterium]|nr:YeaH/YhbH family protein [Alphaproteobacteria bacterium]
MQQFIDRRQNPKDRSLGNRQRFIRRAREQIKEVVNRSISDRKIEDIGSGDDLSIPSKGIGEPRLHNSRKGGWRERVLPGNKEFVTGDRVAKPPSGGKGAGKEGGDQGEGEDDFRFTLSREEFLDLFFEDLELPDLVKINLKEITAFKLRRSGFARTGNPSNLDVMRTMRNSLGRRIALNRPDPAMVLAKEAEVLALEEATDDDEILRCRLDGLVEELDVLTRRQKVVAYIDPVDVRFRQRVPEPAPNTKAVMFCLMDVSGSMGEREKDLAKRFFVLLHLFLKRRYERIDVVFIRHTHEAQEVDEETFFYSRQSGGTVVSTALDKMMEVVRERYPTDTWNIYAAQASDGENFSGDSENCLSLLRDEVMPVCQYYAYVEILDEREFELFGNPEAGAALWRSYKEMAADRENFAMKRIARPADIYPVFRELFSRQPEGERRG